MTAKRERFYRDVESLTSITPARNYLNLACLEKVTGYIADELEQAGARPKIQT
jgi:hypothetical protein